MLQALTRIFVNAIIASTKKMPYGMRCIAREMLLELRVCVRFPASRHGLTFLSLQVKFPDAPEELYAACIGRVIYYRFINPAIV